MVTLPLSVDLLGLDEFKLELRSKNLPTPGIYTFNAENKPLLGVGGANLSGTTNLAIIKAPKETSMIK